MHCIQKHTHTHQKGVTLTLQYIKCVQTPYHLVYIRTKLNYIVCRYFIHCTQPLKMKSSIRTRSLWCESTFFWQTFEAIWNFPYIWYVTCYINMQAMYYLSNVECWMSNVECRTVWIFHAAPWDSNNIITTTKMRIFNHLHRYAFILGRFLCKDQRNSNFSAEFMDVCIKLPLHRLWTIWDEFAWSKYGL